MAYGDFYRPRRAARMGDLIDPRLQSGAALAGVTPPPVVSAPTGAAPPVLDPNDPRLQGGTQSAGVPPQGDARTASPFNDRRFERDPYQRRPRHTEGPGDLPADNPGGHTQPTAPQTPATTPGGIRARTYQGGPLAYYGTGNIDGVEDIFKRSRESAGSGVLTGFDEGRWGSGERGTMSIKNVNGAIFKRYPAKPSSIDLVMADPDFKALFPNAKKVGFDKIDYGDGYPVDVLKNADPEKDVADAWAWQPENEAVPDGAGNPALADDQAFAGGTNTTQPTGGREPYTATGYRSAIDRNGGYRGPSFRDWVDEASSRYL